MIEFSTMNGIRERMKKCIREAMTGELVQGSGTEPFRPMDRIQTVSQLEKCVDWIALAYDEKIAHREPTDEGYCLCMDSVPAGHEIFLIGTLYVLLCAGAEIWVNMDMEEAGYYQNLVLLAAFEKEFEQIRAAEDYGDLELTLGMLRRDHRVCHVIEIVPICHTTAPNTKIRRCTSMFPVHIWLWWITPRMIFRTVNTNCWKNSATSA